MNTLESGDPLEVSGQMNLEFIGAVQSAPVQLRLVPTPTAADLYERGVEQERAGLFIEAERSIGVCMRLRASI
jgi:hypothetical protein